jgi:hypothetical protein
MGKINVGRLILGGIVAGIVGDLLDYPVDGVWLAKAWDEGFSALGHGGGYDTSQLVWFNVFGLVVGLVAIWIYAGIRPRFGAGVKTAIYAGIAVWILAFLVPNAAFMCVSGLFSKHLTLYTTAGAFVECVAGAIAGAALYKEG